MDHENSTSPRYAVYARSATDIARASSIADQVNTCIAAAANISPNLTLADNCVFTDAGISGNALSGRPGLSALLKRAAERPNPFDRVLMTGTDRLGRDLKSVLKIVEILSSHGIVLHFVEQRISSIDRHFEDIIGLSGMLDAQFIDGVRTKVRRGLRGRALTGSSTGGRCYGYSSHVSSGGTRLTIVEREAATIRRVYSDFASGLTASEIASALNAEQVPGPRRDAGHGKPVAWTSRHVYTILRRERYRGTLVWGCTQMVRNMTSGKLEARRQPESAVVRVEVPHLAIVAADLAKTVDERLAAMSGDARPAG